MFFDCVHCSQYDVCGLTLPSYLSTFSCCCDIYLVLISHVYSSQMTALLVIFLVGGQIESQLLSTGAFEVSLNG